MDYRKRRTEHAPILLDGAVVEQVESFKFIGVHIYNKLEWSKHIKTVVKTKPIPPQVTEKIWHGSTAASLPGMAIARPLTARHYRG